MQDPLGRELVALYAARGALVTASASVTNGTPTTLIAGDTSYPLDILNICFSNNSTVAVVVLLKDDGTTVRTVSIPASATVELNPSVPIPQILKGGNWQIDMPDITATTVTVEAILLKNS